MHPIKRCRRSLARPNWTSPEYPKVDYGVVEGQPQMFCFIPPIASVGGMRPLRAVNWHRLLPCPQPAERAMSWRASHIHSLDWLPLLMLVAECSLRTHPLLHLIGMARLFLKVGARPPAPNFGAGRSSHKNHCRPTCPKHNSSCSMLHHLIPAPPPCQATGAVNATFCMHSNGFLQGWTPSP